LCLCIVFVSRCLISSILFLYSFAPHLDLHSFPTRRSSDLSSLNRTLPPTLSTISLDRPSISSFGLILNTLVRPYSGMNVVQTSADRKSTRLNSSHVSISYAVFCLKKKNNTHTNAPSSATTR